MITAALLAGALVAAALARAAVARRCERQVAARLPLGAGGVVRGAEPIDLAGDGGRAVLLLHGFGDTPQAVGYLAEHLHAAGWTVRAPLLPGHGGTLRDFAAASADDWLACARAELAALRARHASVAVVGLSMGGALSTVITAETADVRAVALVAPYLAMPAAIERLARAHRLWSPFAPYVRGRGERSIHDPAEQARSRGYGLTTPRLLYELLRVVRLAREAAPRVTAPVLVVQSREDNRIPPDAAERAFARFGAAHKQLVWLDGCGHVLTVDYGRERVFEAVAGWLASHAGAPAPTATAERPGTAPASAPALS